jgi:hypothetical protein
MPFPVLDSVTAVSAWGWGQEGHVIVAKIAEINLSKEAKAAIKDLLDGRSIADSRLANWADFIKRSAAFRKKYPNNNLWHFVDIPYDATEFDPAKHCKNKNCVIDAIERFKKVLADKEAKAVDRKEALLFLVHLVGDLHQPLHSAERNGDHGGNKLLVNYPGQDRHHPNLHQVWDTNLVRENLGDLTPLDYAWRLNMGIKSEFKDKVGKGTVKDWAWETHELAVKHAYRNADGEELPREGLVELDEAYVKKNKAVVRDQFLKGGIRLAKVLNDVFKGGGDAEQENN